MSSCWRSCRIYTGPQGEGGKEFQRLKEDCGLGDLYEAMNARVELDLEEDYVYDTLMSQRDWLRIPEAMPDIQPKEDRGLMLQGYLTKVSCHTRWIERILVHIL